jgi:hypothetical protein
MRLDLANNIPLKPAIEANWFALHGHPAIMLLPNSKEQPTCLNIRIAGYHPAPWKATKGGFGYDIEVELVAPGQTALGKSFDAKELIWWIAALLRMAGFPYLYVPVISDHPFQDIPTLDREPTLVPVETEPLIFRPTERRMGILDTQNLEWVAAT